MTITREQVLRYRFRRHGLDAARGSKDTPLLDYGIQDTGPDGARWALAVRGVDLDVVEPLVYAWTLRGAPHAYRRGDIGAVAVATSPFSEADAAKRIYDASKPLRDAGIPVLDALRTVAAHLRDLVTDRMVKGDASGALGRLLDAPFLRECRPCDAIHIYEMPFRLAALQAGLELEPGTSPPVLRQIPDLEPLLFSRNGAEAEPRFDVVRNHLRFFGPTTVREAATFLDSPVTDVRDAWPADAVEVEVGDETKWLLADDVEELHEAHGPGGVVRLVGPYDPFLQARDREMLVHDPDRRAALWPTLGRPGAVLVDGWIAGTWRPRTARKRLSLHVEPWTRLTKDRLAALGEQAERLASFRGVALDRVELPD